MNSVNSGETLLKIRQYQNIHDQPISYKRVALAPGKSKNLSWDSVKIIEKGTHTINIGDMKPMKVNVKY